MIPKEIIIIKLTDSWSLDVQIGPITWAIILALTILLLVLRRQYNIKRWQPVEIEVPFGGGKVKIVPNHNIIRIAHQSWTEIITRKVGLKFDEEHDVIIEVYNSWYDVFKEIRLLIKTIPAEDIRSSKDASQLVLILLKVLNEGLRPHLTQWQARFRRWYSATLEKQKDATPQDIQKNYPQYRELVDDLIKVNEQMVDFAEQLRKIVQG